MDSWLSFFIMLLVFVEVPVCLCSYDWYTRCSSRFDCGDITGLGYPFWGDGRPDGCGNPDSKLICTKNITSIEIMNLEYRVLSADPGSKTLKIVRDDFLDGICSPVWVNTTLDTELFEYGPSHFSITLLYGCPSFPNFYPPISFCSVDGTANKGVYIQDPTVPGVCAKSVVVPVLATLKQDIGNWSRIEDIIKGGFDVKWKEDPVCIACTVSKGVCGYDQNTNQTTCYCPNQSSNGLKICAAGDTQVPSSKSGSKGSNNAGIVIGVAVGAAGIVAVFLGCLVFAIRQRRKKPVNESKSKDLPTPPSSKGFPVSSTNFSRSTPSYPSPKLDLERGSTYFGAHIFSYEELEEATNRFDPSRQLGDGGFGTVYYGELHDGRVVAVKRLYENNFKRVEQFMTEVEILTRLRHPNLVLLHGCTSKRSQELLLVYEYISNGTVSDHLNGNRSSSALMTWPVRLSIAIESAEALAYLHESDVIHRDVKTTNILLDDKFRVKVSDFGLSRLFPTDVTHVSTAPQGTPGYVDPEYYQCYQLTDKSDVYSFGVVLVELISSLPAVDTNRHRHDINLANMAINKIQNHALHELVDPSLGFEKDYDVRRMTTSVAELAFRCLQQERDMRPSMDEVVEVLRGIKNEEIGVQKAEVVDISADDVGLLKNIPPPLSPDSSVKWASSSTTPNSF
ncbi:LEAF RUST 10 DISEASE-RESISTANCE LOCUS RECEPTOR-LIKE PROTEIN KINASE-like 1.4 isoform X3 [Corylus avellana]|uniref:LEAF RUST 10 DISEASE-RESISTANCE LOCUS RECEPTOR-LIKE PROTEIN KINASE-like 1.4 isoform X3 n=1 Tax=Corylus avellana TaxID=13451 RepID=UPI00286C3589|nr:LEAF RUST 10 DISEASE-RESISTANCE LOCUS RECEPTOR-LIKE PROTEIN KINASE-like 1.4 isoform X3 [Corylus avellana]